MKSFNDLGINGKLDFPRIRKLLLIGVFASILHITADFILGWGVKDESKSGILAMLSAYTGTPDGGIFAAAIMGLVGTFLESLCFFGIYRLIADRSQKFAHSYRSGIIGYLAFGACGFHVPVCAAVFLMKHGVEIDLLSAFGKFFVLPAVALFFVFLLVLSVSQIAAFAKGYTPYPKAFALFSMPVGMFVAVIIGCFGNYPFTNAVSCAWIAIGCLWTFGGLLAGLKNAEKESGRKEE